MTSIPEGRPLAASVSPHGAVVFEQKDREENERRKEQLTKAIASGETVLFAGAGCSAPLSYDTWPRLLKDLGVLANGCGGTFDPDPQLITEDPLTFVDKAKEHIQNVTGSLDRYGQFLYRKFETHNKGPKFLELHEDLIALPFRGVITTNFDQVLEEALVAHLALAGEARANLDLSIHEDAPPEVSRFLLSLADRTLPKRIAHLHGVYKRPNGIILSRRDYETAYGFVYPAGGDTPEVSAAWGIHRKILWAILATRCLIFVGFSLSDPYILVLLDAVSRDLWQWHESVHFAIVPISIENAEYTKLRAESWLSQYGIDVVFYENPDGTHRALLSLIREIRHKCSAPSQPTVRQQINARMRESLKIR
jgi:hypothetical protein